MRSMMARAVSFGSIGLGLWATTAAHAGVFLEVTWDGGVTSVSGSPLGAYSSIRVGQGMRIVALFEAAAPDRLGLDPNQGLFDSLGWSVSVGSVELAGYGGGMLVRSSYEVSPGSYTDSIEYAAGEGGVFAYARMSTGSFDAPPGAIGSGSVPQDLVFARFFNQLQLVGSDWWADGIATSYSTRIIPTPASLATLGMAGLAVGRRRR